MKVTKIKAVIAALLVSTLTLTGCGDTDTGKYEEYILGALNEKYGMDFEFTDSKYLKMSNSSVTNDDLIYGYVHPVSRGQYENQNFYVETTSACLEVKDSFVSMKIQNQLNNKLSSDVLNVQTIIQTMDDSALRYEKPKLNSLNSYELPFDATCLISVDVNADLQVDVLTKELYELCEKLNEYTYNENGCLVLFINPEYEGEAIRYINHDLKLDAKLDQSSVYASLNINNLEETEKTVKEKLEVVAEKIRELRKKK